MSYIGKEPQTGAYSMLDSLTASATASYSLTLDSVAFVPESANHLLVSLNGVIQKAGSSYTVSGSTLTFSSALTSSDSIDFVLALGNVLDIGTPSDATVTNAKTNFVSTSSAAGLQIKGDGTTDGTLQLNCSQNSHGIKLKSPAHSASQSYTLTFPTTAPSANKALITDGSGNLSFGDAGGDLTPSFSIHLNSNQTLSNNTLTKITIGDEDHDSDSAFASNKFTVPSGEAGKYNITLNAYWSFGNTESASEVQLHLYKNGSSVQREWISFNPTGRLSGIAQTLNVTVTLAESDYLEMYALGYTGGASIAVVNDQTRMSGFKILGA